MPKYLNEQIIKGDRSDGMPNILSEDDVFVTGEKQEAHNKKRLQRNILILVHIQIL